MRVDDSHELRESSIQKWYESICAASSKSASQTPAASDRIRTSTTPWARALDRKWSGEGPRVMCKKSSSVKRVSISMPLQRLDRSDHHRFLKFLCVAHSNQSRPSGAFSSTVLLRINSDSWHRPANPSQNTIPTRHAFVSDWKDSGNSANSSTLLAICITCSCARRTPWRVCSRLGGDLIFFKSSIFRVSRRLVLLSTVCFRAPPWISSVDK